MVSTSQALVDVADSILNRLEGLSSIQISTKGRRYKFVNNAFQRVKEEDKHLVIHPSQLSQHIARTSAYAILESIDPEIFSKHPDLCIMIVGMADAMEKNGWYEQENSSVIQFQASSFEPDAAQAAAASELVARATPRHLEMGANILYCSKLSFLHTDHHVGVRIEGQHMGNFIAEYFGDASPESVEVLLAVKSFVHWGNIKGILYKLKVPRLSISDELVRSFAAFPEPTDELRRHVFDRFPAGTSRYALVWKTLKGFAEHQYAKVLPYPQAEAFDLDWLTALRYNIERDPAKFHLRAKVKCLSENPVNLKELTAKYAGQLDALYVLIALVNHVFPDMCDMQIPASKLPECDDKLLHKYGEYHQQLVGLRAKIDDYESSGWACEDIVRRVGPGERNLHDYVAAQTELQFP